MQRLTLVIVGLHPRHLNAEDLLRFRRELFDDILLQPPEHEGAELLMQIFDLGLLIDIVQVEIIGELDCELSLITTAAYISPASGNASMRGVLLSQRLQNGAHTFDVVL